MTVWTQDQIKAAADRAEARARGETAKDFVETTVVLDIEIKKLAALSIGVYESSRVAEAKRLGMRASVLDKLVQAERDKAGKGQKDFLPHWKVGPWPDSVDGAALLETLRQHFGRYVVVPEHADVVLALWTLDTWVFDCFDITPYLAITSPTRRCGKTLLMTMLYWLCCRAKKNDSMSKASIYRSVEAERPTLILDEVGWVVDLKDERQGILCGGFERLGYVEVCEGEGADITTKQYSTYCPKAFGLIGKLTPTLMDRSIEIRMQRKLREKVERLRRRDNEQHVDLRRKCLRWASENRNKLAATTPKEPDRLNDRAFDAWEPLLAIAEHVGGDWPKLALDAAIALSGGESAAEERGIELLHDIKAEFDRRGPAITTKTLIAALCADEEKPWATYNRGQRITDRQLAKLLKPFEVISENLWPSETGEPQAKGYRLLRFDDAFSRYLTGANVATCQDGGSQASVRPNDDEMGTTSDFCVRPGSVTDGYEKREKPANDGHSDARTDRNSKPDHAHHSSHSNGSARAFRSDVEDAREELRLREQAEDDLGIPAFLDRRHEVCARCGEPGGTEWDYDGIKVRLHERCEEPWIDARLTEDKGPSL